MEHEQTEYTLRKCGMDDLATLCELSYTTYNETFGHMNTPSNMKAYLDKAFNRDKLQSELSDINSEFYFICSSEKLSGYLKLNEHLAQTDIHDPQSLEIERIYVKKESQGKGLGEILINEALRIAELRGKQYAWLGVWEQNDKAVLFYKNSGFYVAGTHSFVMGDDVQTDLIMRKDLL